MRILHIDETFHPSFGYQCNPLAKFQSFHGYDVYIIAPEAKYIYSVYESFGISSEGIESEDTDYEKHSDVKIIRVPAKGRIMGRLNYKMKELYTVINNVKPDAIMVHCLETLTAIRLLRNLKNKYPMVFDSHMLSMASLNKFSRVFEWGFKILCTRIIEKKNFMVIKTQNDDYITSHLGVPEKQTKFISFGTDTTLFYPDSNKKKQFLKDKGLPENTFVITSTGKLSPTKGGMLFGEAMKKRFSNRPVAVVVVAGFPDEYEKKVKEILDNSENNVFFYPVQKYLNLPLFYQLADVTVFPKQCSMSFYDAQSCGCPVISEKGHVNEERNSHCNGLNFECDSVDDLRVNIQQLIDMPENDYQKMRENSFEFVSKHYSYDLIATQYTEELIRAYDIFHSVN